MASSSIGMRSNVIIKRRIISGKRKHGAHGISAASRIGGGIMVASSMAAWRHIAGGGINAAQRIMRVRAS